MEDDADDEVRTTVTSQIRATAMLENLFSELSIYSYSQQSIWELLDPGKQETSLGKVCKGAAVQSKPSSPPPG